MLPDMKYYAAQNEIILQLVPVSMTTVAGGNAADSPSSGELALNYVVVSGHEVSYDDVILGDIDGSGDVEITDATVLQRWLADIMPLSSASIKAGCVCGTETPDISDVTIIQRALADIVNPYLNLS